MVESFPDSVRGARCSTSRGSFRGRSGTAMLRVAVVVCGRDAFKPKRMSGHRQHPSPFDPEPFPALFTAGPGTHMCRYVRVR
jgi:hypothetical protein